MPMFESVHGTAGRKNGSCACQGCRPGENNRARTAAIEQGHCLQAATFGFLLALVMLLPCRALAGDFSIRGSLAGGDEDTLAYELDARYTFDPWLDGTIILRPLVELGGFAWDRSNDTVWGGSASVGLTLEIVTTVPIRPFITGTVGAALLSDNKIGNRRLGKNAQIKSRGAAGIRFGEEFAHSVYFEVTHYSNAGSNCDNSGFTTYGGGYAYTF